MNIDNHKKDLDALFTKSRRSGSFTPQTMLYGPNPEAALYRLV